MLGPVLGAYVIAVQLGACAAVWSGPAAASQDAPAANDAPEPDKIVMPVELRGLYTSAQAARGERRFAQLCADCHRTVEITRSWFSGNVHQTAGELFVIMSMTMPDSSPGSLDDDDYADILAYLLQLNGYPAGDEELPSDPSLLASIPIPVP